MDLDGNIVAKRERSMPGRDLRARGVEIAQSWDLDPRPIAPCDLGLPPLAFHDRFVGCLNLVEPEGASSFMRSRAGVLPGPGSAESLPGLGGRLKISGGGCGPIASSAAR